MGRPSSLLSKTNLEHRVTMLKALAHPVRLQIVTLLCLGGEATVTDLCERLEVPQPIVSQQLRVLRMSRLVGDERRDGFNFYRVLEPRLHTLVECISSCSA
jgi:DNA-binding transcriptional ArsR family regulator